MGSSSTAILVLLCIGIAAIKAGLAVQTPGLHVFLVANNLCLTLSAEDMATVTLEQCGKFGYQQWDLTSGERVQMGQSCLDAFPGPTGALQLKPCTGALSQSWTFRQDGTIMNRAQTSGCLTSSQGTVRSTLFLTYCGPQSTRFFMSNEYPDLNPAFGQQQQQAPGLPKYTPPQQSTQFGGNSMLPPVQGPGQLPPLSPVGPQTSQQLPPLIDQPQAPATMSQQIQQQAISHEQQQTFGAENEPAQPELGHYLCTCIEDSNTESCNDAVRAACTVGHLDANACRESFRGSHNRITDEILRLIQNGAKCANYTPKQIKQAELPKNAFRGHMSGMPSAEDHYLCTCLESRSSSKCLTAVKAACLVGHIPAGDCEASLSKNRHDAVTNHILRLIDSGAGCSQTLRKEVLQDSTPPPTSRTGGMISRMIGRGGRPITKDNQDLCTCLDDPNSVLCGNAMKRACAQKRIPKEDCDVAAGQHFMGGVTKVALRLIDHGAQCPAHRSMTFTNHGCHCLQTWTEAGKTYTFPNNCVDAGGKRGFAWCKTFASEHCAGVGGSVEWDRCDVPKYPAKSQEIDTDGDGIMDTVVGEDNHYLCICLAQTSTDEVCVAAVKAACAVGHLPSDACRASFDSKDHSKVSDMVVKLLEGGARCQETMGNSFNSYTPKPGETQCPKGYYGFPQCRRKVECRTSCGHGQQCDHSDGTCRCLPNFTGKNCGQCAEGYSGRHCTPKGRRIGGWTLGQGLVYLFLFAGLVYAGFTFYKRMKGDPSLSVTYQRLGGAGASAAAAYHKKMDTEDDPEEGITMESDLGGDDTASGSETRKEQSSPHEDKPKHIHTGLAV